MVGRASRALPGDPRRPTCLSKATRIRSCLVSDASHAHSGLIDHRGRVMPGLPPPYYFRPLDHLYTLFSHDAYGWWTGVVRGGEQWLLGPTATLRFDMDGNLLG